LKDEADTKSICKITRAKAVKDVSGWIDTSIRAASRASFRRQGRGTRPKVVDTTRIGARTKGPEGALPYAVVFLSKGSMTSQTKRQGKRFSLTAHVSGVPDHAFPGAC